MCLLLMRIYHDHLTVLSTHHYVVDLMGLLLLASGSVTIGGGG